MIEFERLDKPLEILKSVNFKVFFDDNINSLLLAAKNTVSLRRQLSNSTRDKRVI